MHPIAYQVSTLPCNTALLQCNHCAWQHALQLQHDRILTLKHVVTQLPVAIMQETITYWGGRLFSYMNAKMANSYVFQMYVDNAARLWVDNTLVINATCATLAHHLHVAYLIFQALLPDNLPNFVTNHV